MRVWPQGTGRPSNRCPPARWTSRLSRGVQMRTVTQTSSVPPVERAPVVALAAAAVAGVGVTLGSRHRARRAQVTGALATRQARPSAPGEVRLSVVVPAFREERIGTTVARLRKDLVEVDN